jgi:simple sugar transport system ATP-binding protein
VHDIHLQIAAGEVVGVAGVAGNGQNALADACAGVLGLEAGEVIVDGESVFAPRQRSRGSDAVAYIPEQPLHNAVAPDLSAEVNLFLKRIRALPWLPDRRAMQREAEDLMARFDVRPRDAKVPAQALSGGNLQKLVAARELSHLPALVVACYPTMGLDLAASARVYDALFALARSGSAVLWVSEDLDDLMRFAHRIVVLFRGRVAGVADVAAATREQLGAWMTGLTEAAA